MSDKPNLSVEQWRLVREVWRRKARALALRYARDEKAALRRAMEAQVKLVVDAAHNPDARLTLEQVRLPGGYDGYRITHVNGVPL